jgi:formylglycine-generating enzyme required for sulfatase activity
VTVPFAVWPRPDACFSVKTTAIVVALLLSAHAAADELPGNMVLIPAGQSVIGSEQGLDDERPVFKVQLPDFLFDRTPVTVAAFAAFVQQTGYVTTAEQFGSCSPALTGVSRWVPMVKKRPPIIRLPRCRGTTRKPIAAPRTNACPAKWNGSLQRAVVTRVR